VKNGGTGLWLRSSLISVNDLSSSTLRPCSANMERLKHYLGIPVKHWLMARPQIKRRSRNSAG
jgi:hypothetical protein